MSNAKYLYSYVYKFQLNTLPSLNEVNRLDPFYEKFIS